MQSEGLTSDWVREELSEYVAHLQLHMALQARNLVPSLTQKHTVNIGEETSPLTVVLDSREQFLQQTQATIEKIASRQII